MSTPLDAAPRSDRQSRSPDARTGGPRAAVRRWFGPLLHATTWKETAALLLALPTGVVWFTVATTGLSVAAGLLITVVGLPLLLLVLRVGRLVAAAERVIARRLLDLELAPPPPVRTSGPLWTRVRSASADRPSWKGLAYAVVSLPVGIVSFTITVVLWAVTVAMVSFPATQVLMSGTDDVPDALSSLVHGWGRVGASTAIGVVGLALVAVTPRLVHHLADVQRRLLRGMLSGG